MATSEGIPSSIDIEFLELNDNPYLFWDWESYQNMQNQNNMAIAFANVIKNNAMQQQPTTNIENEVGKEIPSKP